MTGRQAGGRQNQQHCEDCLVKQASFGYGDRKQRQWCSGCAKQHPGAIDKSYRLCMDCQERRAHFGPADGPKNRWCGECAGLHLGAVKARRAKAMCQTCQQKQASFGLPENLSRQWCAECSKEHPGAINKNVSMCEDCANHQASYGLPNIAKRKWCGPCSKNHALAVDKNRRVCEGCRVKPAQFGRTTGSKRRWCGNCVASCSQDTKRRRQVGALGQMVSAGASQPLAVPSVPAQPPRPGGAPLLPLARRAEAPFSIDPMEQWQAEGPPQSLLGLAELVGVAVPGSGRQYSPGWPALPNPNPTSRAASAAHGPAAHMYARQPSRGNGLSQSGAAQQASRSPAQSARRAATRAPELSKLPGSVKNDLASGSMWPQPPPPPQTHDASARQAPLEFRQAPPQSLRGLAAESEYSSGSDLICGPALPASEYARILQLEPAGMAAQSTSDLAARHRDVSAVAVRSPERHMLGTVKIDRELGDVHGIAYLSGNVGYREAGSLPVLNDGGQFMRSPRLGVDRSDAIVARQSEGPSNSCGISGEELSDSRRQLTGATVGGAEFQSATGGGPSGVNGSRAAGAELRPGLGPGAVINCDLENQAAPRYRAPGGAR